MKRKIKGLIAVITVILIVSLAFNYFLAVKYTDLARRHNTTWSNAITHFVKAINRASLNSGDLSNDQQEWVYRLDETQDNMRLLQEQLGYIEILPYAGVTIN